MGDYIWWAAITVSALIGFSLLLTLIAGVRETIHYNHVNNRIDIIRDTSYLMEVEGNKVTIHWPDGTTEHIERRETETPKLFGQRISDLIDGKLAGDF